jgi:hypothetical protein
LLAASAELLLLLLLPAAIVVFFGPGVAGVVALRGSALHSIVRRVQTLKKAIGIVLWRSA